MLFLTSLQVLTVLTDLLFICKLDDHPAGRGTDPNYVRIIRPLFIGIMFI